MHISLPHENIRGFQGVEKGWIGSEWAKKINESYQKIVPDTFTFNPVSLGNVKKI